MILVAEPAFHDEIKEAVQDYPFGEKLVILTLSEVEKAKANLKALKDLRQKILD
jgi:hypothetical protein